MVHTGRGRGSVLLGALIAALAGAIGWVAHLNILMILLLVVLASLRYIVTHWTMTAEFSDIASMAAED